MKTDGNLDPKNSAPFFGVEPEVPREIPKT
jgi:hypothetical protein